ncbi:MAG: PAS domain S-box protein [Alphaproteobacteria bacterium]
MGEFGTFSWAYLRDNVLNTLEEGVCIFDRNFRIIISNQALPALLDQPASAFDVDRSLQDVFNRCLDKDSHTAENLNLTALLRPTPGTSTNFVIQRQAPVTVHVKSLTRDLTMAVVSRQHQAIEAQPQISEWENKYRDIIDQAAAPVLIHRDSRILFVNRALADQVGLPADVFIGRDLRDFLPEQEVSLYEERNSRDEIGLWEVKIQLPDGRLFWAEAANAEVEWDGEPARQVTLQDVSSRKATEQVLERQAIVMQQIGEGVIISDLNGNVIDCNDSACRIYQIPREDFIGSSVRRLITDEPDLTAYIAKVNEQIGRAGSFYEKTSYTRPDGTSRFVDVSVSAWVGPDGAPLGRIAVARDATDRRRAEQAAARTEAKFKNLIEGSLQGVLIHRNQAIVYVNRATANLFGTIPENMIGRLVTDFIDPATAEQRQAFMESAIADPMKVRATHNDGGTIWIEVNARDVDWDGEAARQVMINDITERQKAEEALQHTQKLESLGQLTGGIAHDFNNLLGVISGNLELLREQLGDSEDHTMFIEASLRSVRRGAELTQRLLAFSRKTPLKPQDTEINQLIRSMSGMLQRTLGETIQVETELEQTAWHVSIDPGQMENALLNLALNARDAMPRGGRLVLETENVLLRENLIGQNSVVPAGDYLKVCVRDTGTGMPAEVLKNAFQPFYTTKEVGAGSGLGLSMVYGFAQQSAGHVTIDSTPGRGTSINLYFPKSELQPRTEEVGDSKQTAPEGNKEIVMVVEDDEDLRQLSLLLLNRMGYQTHDAADGPSAMALLEDLDHIDLLFTDLVLPGGLGGFEIANAAKDAFPDIKVLFTSGYSESETFREAFEGGRAELIPKPYRKDALAERLQAVLQS